MFYNFNPNMLKTTFIARASDGLILSETYDTDSTPQGKRLFTEEKVAVC